MQIYLYKQKLNVIHLKYNIIYGKRLLLFGRMCFCGLRKYLLKIYNWKRAWVR